MEIEFDLKNKVVRKFTPAWSKDSVLNYDNLGRVVNSLVEQRTQMVGYIEMLHDKMDKIIQDNNICEICFRANCRQDHK
jgi:hypothetical protein